MSREVRIVRFALSLATSLTLATLGSTAHANESATSASTGRERPNILLLVAEDLSPRIGAFGDALARTPNLDRLADEGTRFTNVFTTAGVCAPSRAALMLGRHQISTGTQHMRSRAGGYLAVPPEDAKAFPELLRAAGYFTYQTGKLDYQFSGTLGGSGPSSIWDAEDDDAQWTMREEGQPFFGMVNFMATHESGVMAPLGSWPHGPTHFVMQVIQWYGRRGYSEAVVPTDPASVALPPYYPDLPEVRSDLARHYDNVQIMDAQVAALLDRLEREGLADDTIVVWTSDHGDGLPRAKRDLYDSGLRIPMIIRWPARFRPTGHEPGGVEARLISFVDLTVALLGMAGLEAPDGMHGRDFLAPDEPARSFVFASRDRIDDKMDRQRAVRDERFKYIWSGHPDLPESDGSAYRENLDGMRAMRAAYRAGALDDVQRRWFEAPGQERLFDLDKDPHEIHDLAGDATHQPELERMRSAYTSFRERVEDLSDVPEATLAERFWPDGDQPVTATPSIAFLAGRAQLECETPGASLEIAIDDGPWRLYTDPLAIPIGAHVSARAVRYGFAESDVANATRPPDS